MTGRENKSATNKKRGTGGFGEGSFGEGVKNDERATYWGLISYMIAWYPFFFFFFFVIVTNKKFKNKLKYQNIKNKYGNIVILDKKTQQKITLGTI